MTDAPVKINEDSSAQGTAGAPHYPSTPPVGAITIPNTDPQVTEPEDHLGMDAYFAALERADARWPRAIRVIRNVRMMTRPETLFIALNTIMVTSYALDEVIETAMMISEPEDAVEKLWWNYEIMLWQQRQDQLQEGLIALQARAIELLVVYGLDG